MLWRLFIFLLLTGCAHDKASNLVFWESQPTPVIFQNNSKWILFLLDGEGNIIKTLNVDFTHDSADTCVSGVSRKLRILSEAPGRSELFLGEPAYDVRGAVLIINLSANLCDAGYELIGHISMLGVEGYHQSVSMYGGEVFGRFYGVPLSPAN